MIDNTKLPVYPLPIAHLKEGEIMDTCDYGKGNVGFSKLELASLMIAQGLAIPKIEIEIIKAAIKKTNL